MELFTMAEEAYTAFHKSLGTNPIAFFDSLEKPVKDAWISAVTQIKSIIPLPELLQLAYTDSKKDLKYSEMVTCSSKIEQAQVWYNRYDAHLKKDLEAAKPKWNPNADTE